jgi:hypothetical protein
MVDGGQVGREPSEKVTATKSAIVWTYVSLITLTLEALQPRWVLGDWSWSGALDIRWCQTCMVYGACVWCMSV